VLREEHGKQHVTSKKFNEADWRFDTIGAYYDEEEHSLSVQGAKLAKLSDANRKRAADLIAQRVKSFSKLFDNDVIVQVVLSMIEDLYRAGIGATEWGPGHESYVAAVWGTMFAVVKDRGFTIRYVVENTWPQDLLRPVQFFPNLFGLTGIVYICPSEIASELPELEGAPITTEGMKTGLPLGRHIAQEAVKKVAEQGKHFAYFETDFEPGCLDSVFALSKPAGTIQIFRNEAPDLGTKVELTLVPLEESPPAN